MTDSSAPYQRLTHGGTGNKFGASKPKPLAVPTDDPWALPTVGEEEAPTPPAPREEPKALSKKTAPKTKPVAKTSTAARKSTTATPVAPSGALWAFATVDARTSANVRERANRERMRLSDVVIQAVAAYDPAAEAEPPGLTTGALPIAGPRSDVPKIRDQYRVTPAQHTWLVDKVEQSGLNMTTLVGRALEHYFTER